MVYHYALLCAITHYYVTIMTLIAIIAIIAFSHYSQRLKCAFSEQNKHPGWTAHREYHVGEQSRRLDQLVWSLTWTCCSWDLHTDYNAYINYTLI